MVDTTLMRMTVDFRCRWSWPEGAGEGRGRRREVRGRHQSYTEEREEEYSYDDTPHTGLLSQEGQVAGRPMRLSAMQNVKILVEEEARATKQELERRHAVRLRLTMLCSTSRFFKPLHARCTFNF